MNAQDIKTYFENPIVGFKFEKSIYPYNDVLDQFNKIETTKNLKRFNQLKSSDKQTVLNLKILQIQTSYGNKAYISVIHDSKKHKYVVFFNIYKYNDKRIMDFFETDEDETILIKKIYDFLTDEKLELNKSAINQALIFN